MYNVKLTENQVNLILLGLEAVEGYDGKTDRQVDFIREKLEKVIK